LCPTYDKKSDQFRMSKTSQERPLSTVVNTRRKYQSKKMLVYSCVEPFQEEEELRKIFPGCQPSASCGLPVATDSSAFLSSPQHVTRGEEIFVIFRLDRIRALFISSYLSPVFKAQEVRNQTLLTKQNDTHTSVP